MEDLALLLRVFAGVVSAVFRAIVRRLLHGPAAPSWSWSVELRVVALRAVIMTTADHADPVARSRLEARIDPPLPRRVRSQLDMRTAVVAQLPVEWHLPRARNDAAVLLYFHGGGYVGGSPASHRRWVACLALATDCRAVVPEYRLAPMHRFPAAVDDAAAVYGALLAAGESPDRIIVAGDSAGGGLALALLLRVRKEGGPLPAGAMLFSPYADLTHSGASMLRNASTDYLPLGPTRPNYEYLGAHDPHDPLASPLYADLAGLPPMLVFAGEREMILDDATGIVAAAQKAELDVRLHLAAGMMHVWPAVLPEHPSTEAARDAAADWVAQRLGASPSAGERPAEHLPRQR